MESLKAKVISWFSADPLLKELTEAIVGSDMMTPLAAMNVHITSAVLIVGCAMLLYNVVAGTVQTAHEGEILGRRWSSLWAPVRVFFGAAGLVPLFNGMLVIQWLVLFCAALGLSFAVQGNKIAIKYLTKNSAPISFAVSPQLKDTTKAYANQYFCQLYFNDALLAANTPTTQYKIVENIKLIRQRTFQGDFRGNFDTASGAIDAGLSLLKAADQLAVNLSKGKGFGGVMKVTEPKVQSFDLVEIDTTTGQQEVLHDGFCGAVAWEQRVYNEPMVLPILNAHVLSATLARDQIKIAVETFYKTRFGQPFYDFIKQNPSDKLPDSIVKSGQTEFLAAIKNYDSDLKNRVSQAVGQLRQESEKSKELGKYLQNIGYIGAGASWLAITQSQREIYDALDALPTVIEPLTELVFGSRTDVVGVKAVERFNLNFLPDFAKWMSENNRNLAELQGGPTYVDAMFKNSQQAEITAWGSWSGREPERNYVEGITNTGKSGVFAEIATGLKNYLAGHIASKMSAEQVFYNAQQVISDFGHTLMITGGAVFVGGALSEILLDVGFGGVGLGATLFVFGAIIAFGIPWMICIGWVLAVVFWIVSLVVLLIGSTLWALAHLHMDGEGFAGQRAGHGWNALLEVSLKPIFQVFFLHVTQFLLPIVLGILFYVGGILFQWTEITGTGGIIFTILGGIVLSVGAIFLVLNLVLTFHTKADDMMKFMGVSGENDSLTTPGITKGAAALTAGGMYFANNSQSLIKSAGQASQRNINRRSSLREDDYLGGAHGMYIQESKNLDGG